MTIATVLPQTRALNGKVREKVLRSLGLADFDFRFEFLWNGQSLERWIIRRGVAISATLVSASWEATHALPHLRVDCKENHLPLKSALAPKSLIEDLLPFPYVYFSSGEWSDAAFARKITDWNHQWGRLESQLTAREFTFLKIEGVDFTSLLQFHYVRQRRLAIKGVSASDIPSDVPLNTQMLHLKPRQFSELLPFERLLKSFRELFQGLELGAAEKTPALSPTSLAILDTLDRSAKDCLS